SLEIPPQSSRFLGYKAPVLLYRGRSLRTSAVAVQASHGAELCRQYHLLPGCRCARMLSHARSKMRSPTDLPNTLKRVKTGINGLDDILSGGLPRNHLYLLEGDPGTGKTTVALQFLLEGVKNG